MKTPLFIAWRYLFSKKGHQAINIVSGISVAAVAVIAAAMVCVLSVMNGFGTLVESMFSNFDPDLRIEVAKGKSFTLTDSLSQYLAADPNIVGFAEEVSETALLEYKGHQIPAILKGVDERFEQITNIDTTIRSGKFMVHDGAFDRIVFGRGLAISLGVHSFFVEGVHIYSPKRKGQMNMLRPDQNFRQAVAFVSGEFAVNQTQYDDKVALISLPLARYLFDYDSTTVTALLVKVNKETNVKKTQTRLSRFLGPQYRVLNRYEQQEDFFRVLRVEKWLTAVLMVFILLIAGLNMISSLTMLILDKQRDVVTLQNLGADDSLVRRIFLYEGFLINGLGAAIGVVLGLIICFVQEHFGLLKLGTGTEYIISAYPVSVEGLDVLFVLVVVLLLGVLTSYLPTRMMYKQSSHA